MPGAPIPADLKAAKIIQTAADDRVKTIRTRAEKWIPGITALTGLISAALVIKGPDAFSKLAGDVTIPLRELVRDACRQDGGGVVDRDCVRVASGRDVLGIHGRFRKCAFPRYARRGPDRHPRAQVRHVAEERGEESAVPSEGRGHPHAFGRDSARPGCRDCHFRANEQCDLRVHLSVPRHLTRRADALTRPDRSPSGRNRDQELLKRATFRCRHRTPVSGLCQGDLKTWPESRLTSSQVGSWSTKFPRPRFRLVIHEPTRI